VKKEFFVVNFCQKFASLISSLRVSQKKQNIHTIGFCDRLKTDQSLGFIKILKDFIERNVHARCLFGNQKQI